MTIKKRKPRGQYKITLSSGQYRITLGGDFDDLKGGGLGVKMTLEGFPADGRDDPLAAAIMGIMSERMMARIKAGGKGGQSVQ